MYKSLSGELVTLSEALNELRPLCPAWMSRSQLEQRLGFAGGDVRVCLEDAGVPVKVHGVRGTRTAVGHQEQQILAEELSRRLGNAESRILDHLQIPYVDPSRQMPKAPLVTPRDSPHSSPSRRRWVEARSKAGMLYVLSAQWLDYVGPACACIGPLLLLVCLGVAYAHGWIIFMSVGVDHWLERSCQIVSNTSLQQRPYVGLRAHVLVRHGHGDATVTQMAFSSPDGSYSADAHAWPRTRSWIRGYDNRVGDAFQCIVNPATLESDCTSAVGCGRSGGSPWECCGFRVLLGHAGSYPNPFPVASLLWVLGAVTLAGVMASQVARAWELCCCAGRSDPVRMRTRASRSNSRESELV